MLANLLRCMMIKICFRLICKELTAHIKKLLIDLITSILNSIEWQMVSLCCTFFGHLSEICISC
jgi:hypothetical protein